MKKVKVIIPKAIGTNCDEETKYCFERVGASADIVPLPSLFRGYDPYLQKRIRLSHYHIMALPGGFAYGDVAGSGKMMDYDLMDKLGPEINRFIDDGKLIIGICNGFQVLVQAGLLPMFDRKRDRPLTLTNNASMTFQCRPVRLAPPHEGNRCIWTKDVSSIELGVAHGEGMLAFSDPGVEGRLYQGGQVVFEYVDNNRQPTNEFPDSPNGSRIAGICDPTGRILGMMPHPERANMPEQHPDAPRLEVFTRSILESDMDRHDLVKLVRPLHHELLPIEGQGMQIFRNGVEYAREHLL